jgi:aspartyl-tRNA synthetase
MASWQRTHTCGELRESHVGQTVVLNGWVNTYRAYPDQIFVDLRDRYGLTQVVFEADRDPDLFARAQSFRNEWVLSVQGEVAHRLPGKTNEKLATGAVEVKGLSVQVLNRCPTPPFEVTEFGEELANEDLRLQYRYLDLRRASLQRTLMLRHRLTKVIRDHLDDLCFVDLETPLLGRSTPEGARDYLVPSRIFPGQFYALPQSPQLYKQLLMVSGFDKYFQIARCLRDEDLRADRQPEFTQLDLEMSFVEREDIFSVIESLTVAVFEKCQGVTISAPFPRLSYADAMLRYGTDKPDLRYGMEIVDLADLASQSEFSVFRGTLEQQGKVRGFNVKGAAERFSRKGLDELTEQVRRCGAKGLAWIKVEAERFNSPIEKFLPAPVQAALRQQMNAEAGDLLLLVADQEEAVCQSLGTLRENLAEQLGLVDPTRQEYAIAWIIDFPAFIRDEEEGRWLSNHHPFTAPMDEDLARLESDPGSVRAKAYDLVMNGYEAGGGSIRIHNPEVQQRVFSVLGMNEEQARQRFGFLLDALKYGAPPHGGIALGLDRWTMILAGTSNIRDVIAFPKNQRARDLMTGAPAAVESRQLRDLGLHLGQK